MRVTTIQSALVSTLVVLLGASPVFAQATAQPQPPPRPAPSQAPAAEAPTPAPAGQSRRSNNERTVLPQGFSVVLVLGDIQSVTTPDDVPPAARKALNDMKEFLPFKSYKLLDAAWLMCCGQDPRPSNLSRNHPAMLSGRSSVTQMLRGPEEREYELELTTARTEGSRVFVKFTLSGSGGSAEIAGAEATPAATVRNINRRIADLKDTRTMLDKQLQDMRKKVEVGVAPGTDIPKTELEIRRLDREIEELNTRLAEAQAGRSTTPRASVDYARRTTIIDTGFSMDVGETVVVGTSRLKGGSKALIALLTAVPPRPAERKE
jgi:hypothetical protein